MSLDNYDQLYSTDEDRKRYEEYQLVTEMTVAEFQDYYRLHQRFGLGGDVPGVFEITDWPEHLEAAVGVRDVSRESSLFGNAIPGSVKPEMEVPR